MTEHFLFPCTLFAEPLPHRALTILGSCVAVCLYDEMLQYGGINHYMLPWWDGKVMPTPKYGDVAIEKLIEKMRSMGSCQENLVAKIFGGAHQLRTVGSSLTVGDRNVATAEKLLESYRIRIISRSTGGDRGRRILFHTQTNQVLMKYLDNSELEKVDV
jgi:chemotaxis protein CheD